MASTSLRNEWMAEQERLAKLCLTSDHIDWCVHGKFVQGLNHVAGVDVSFFPDGIHAVAAVVVLSYPDMKVVYERCATFKLTVPYMVGFLAFREVPALKNLLEKVPRKYKPQVVLVDGNGVFHPRRCGSATHLGIVTDMPTIGVAKDVLKVDDVGVRIASQIASKLEEASDWAPLTRDGDVNAEPLAMLLRPNFGKKTLVVSAGHRVSLNTAVVLTASLCKSSIPEPIRQADLRSRAAVRSWFDGASLAKLKLGAGDLLDIAVPTLDNSDSSAGLSYGNETVAKRPRREQLNVQGRGRDSKRKLVWKVKTVQSQTNATHGTSTTIEDAALESESTRTPVTEDDLSLTDGAVLLDSYEDSPAESLVWRFFKVSLCGLCIAR